MLFLHTVWYGHMTNLQQFWCLTLLWDFSEFQRQTLGRKDLIFIGIILHGKGMPKCNKICYQRYNLISWLEIQSFRSEARLTLGSRAGPWWRPALPRSSLFDPKNPPLAEEGHLFWYIFCLGALLGTFSWSCHGSCFLFSSFCLDSSFCLSCCYCLTCSFSSFCNFPHCGVLCANICSKITYSKDLR